MEEDELLPGISEERFEIRLGGGELNPNTDVLPEPPVEVELEGGITLTGRDEIGNEFLRGVINDRNVQVFPTDDRVQGYYIAGHDPYYVENTNEALGAIRIQTRRIANAETVSTRAENDLYEAVRRTQNEALWNYLRRNENRDLRQDSLHDVQVNGNRNGNGERIVRTVGARNISGLKKHLIPFLEKLHIQNKMNADTYESILEHIENY